MADLQQRTTNLSLYAIPAAYTLGILPHGYYLVRMMIASGGKWTNVA